ncbi:MAG: hypothetical protein WCF83_08785, partial [Pseudolabrys sp.]
MFANDPERTSPRLINARNSANYERKTLCNALQKELAFSASDFFRSSCIAGTRRGEPMNPSDQSSDAYHQSEIADEIDE